MSDLDELIAQLESDPTVLESRTIAALKRLRAVEALEGPRDPRQRWLTDDEVRKVAEEPMPEMIQADFAPQAWAFPRLLDEVRTRRALGRED